MSITSFPISGPRAVAPNGTAHTSARKVNILLVDDREDKLLAVEALLSPLNQNIIRATSGKEALRQLLQKEFAVILMDVAMPGMDGFETAELIRKRPASEFTPIIFVTSVGDSVNQMYRGYSTGAVDYILTPIIPEVLRTKVSVFVDLYKKSEQIREQAERLRQIEQAEHVRRLAEAVDRLETETKRNRFFTLSVDLLGIANFDGRLLQVNPSWEKVLGYSEEELKTLSGMDLVHPEDSVAMAEQMNLLKSGVRAIYFEGRYRCRDGNYRWLGWTAAPFIADQLIYIFARDITARKEAEEHIQQLNVQLQQRVAALTEVNNELEAFNYSISHDLRAPLRSMQSFAQALLEDPDNRLSTESLDFVNRIIRSGRYMDALLRDLLVYSRLTRAELSPGAVSLDTVIDEVLDQLQKDITERRALIEIERPIGAAIGHAPTLKQLFANLIGNSLKFVHPGQTPNLRIWSEVRRSGFIRLTVADNGIGIAPEHQQKIFGLFERLHSSRDYPGTGIGLALVRKGVERMGGSVGLRSQVGEGSDFWIELPAGHVGPCNSHLRDARNSSKTLLPSHL